MKSKLMAVALFGLTMGTVLGYPALSARYLANDPTPDPISVAAAKPVIDVVFVLDTTGSMAGLIQTAKDKIWSIATTMASAQPTPEIRIGLVGYRDRGDDYVTRVVDLSEDLDSVYAALMDFRADGGGDGPESVNQALYDAVHKISWSRQDQAYQVIFLVGDAPPHMDYQDEMQYPAIVASAAEQGIVINTIQCGDMPATIEPWTRIASLGKGSFFQVEQAGGALAMSTPYDARIAELSAKIDETRLYFGSREEQAAMEAKMAATEKLAEASSDESLARRGVFNASAAGRVNRLGTKELVDAISRGVVDLGELDKDQLPATLQPMSPEEQKAHVAELASEREQLESEVRELAGKRSDWMRKKVEEAGGAVDSLDQKIYDTVSRQAKVAGLEYDTGPAY